MDLFRYGSSCSVNRFQWFLVHQKGIGVIFSKIFFLGSFPPNVPARNQSPICDFSDIFSTIQLYTVSGVTANSISGGIMGLLCWIRTTSLFTFSAQSPSGRMMREYTSLYHQASTWSWSSLVNHREWRGWWSLDGSINRAWPGWVHGPLSRGNECDPRKKTQNDKCCKWHEIHRQRASTVPTGTVYD